MKNFAIIIIYNKKDGRSRHNKTLMSNTQTVICDFYIATGRESSSSQYAPYEYLHPYGASYRATF